MFRSDYQGGAYVDVFAAQGQDPLSKFRVVRSGRSIVKKEFNKNLRSFVLNLEGDASQSRITLPKKSKQCLYLSQSFLVFQLYIPSGQSFALEITILDSSDQKRRLLLSTSYREVIMTALHMKMPATLVTQGTWLNLCLDLSSLTSNAFSGRTFSLVDCLTICANCMLKRIFTLRERPSSSSQSLSGIPSHLDLESERCLTQVLDMDTFEQANIGIRSGTGGQRAQKKLEGDFRPQNATQVPVGIGVAHPSSSQTSVNLNSKTLNSGLDSAIPIVSKIHRRSSAKEVDSPEHSVSSGQFDVHGTKIGPLNSQTAHPKAVSIPRLVPRPPEGDGRKLRVRSADSKKSKIAERQALSKSANVMRSSPKIVEYEKNALPEAVDIDWYSPKRTHSESDANKMHPPVLQSLKQSQAPCTVPEISMTSRSSIADSSTASLTSESGRKCLADSGVGLTFPRADTDKAEVSLQCSTVSRHGRLLPADDAIEEAYFKKHLSPANSGPDDIPSPTSSLASSSNSDSLYLYSSRPHPVHEHLSNHKPSDSDYVSSVESSESSVLLASSSVQTTVDQMKQNAETDNSIRCSCSVSASESVAIKSQCGHLSQSTSSSPTPAPYIKAPLLEAEPIHRSMAKDVTQVTRNRSFGISGHFSVHHSTDSDSMSWMQDSVISKYNDTGNHSSPSKLNLQEKVEATFGSIMEQSRDVDSDDGLSEMSDDASIMIQSPRIKNYRYQDEMKKMGATLDLSATIPATPFVGDQAGPIDFNNNGVNNNGEMRLSDRRRSSSLHAQGEDLLDLLYDPVLSCYYDPKTHKYYELN